MKTLSQSAFHTTTAGGVTSTSPANPPSDSERLARMEAMVEEIYNRICPDRDVPGPLSLERAIRDAIRRSLDTRYLNKPREITGAVVLWADPTMLVRSGTYTTTATIKLVVRDLIPYRIF